MSLNCSTENDVTEPLLVGKPGRLACVLAEGIAEDDGDSPNEERIELKKTKTKLWAALIVAVIFMCIEIAGGIYAGSLAILTDAAHLLSDIGGFAVALIAATWAAKQSSESFSFGNHRLEVLGALASVLSVWGITVLLVYEAIVRLLNPEPVDGKAMTIIAVIGIGVNLALLFILGGHHHHHHHDHHDHDGNHEQHGSNGEDDNTKSMVPHNSYLSNTDLQALERGENDRNCEGRKTDENTNDAAVNESGVGDGVFQREERPNASGCQSRTHKNMNLQGAVIHVIGDFLQSIGVCIAGGLIWYNQDDPRWTIADPICTFLFAVLVLGSTWTTIRDVGDILMERAPPGLRDVEDLRRKLRDVSNALEVHDLHIWCLKPSVPLLCAHVVVRSREESEYALHQVTNYCRDHLKVNHTTFQIVVEGEEPCPCSIGSSHQESQRSSRAPSAQAD